MFGQSLGERGRRMEECLTVLQRAWSGEEFEYDGRTVRVTPRRRHAGGPMLMYGGGSARPRRRRGALRSRVLRADVGAGPRGHLPRRMRAARARPRACASFRRRERATTIFVAEDVDRAWERIGPFMLHDARMYASWLGDTAAASKSTALTIEALRAESGAYRVLTPEQAVEYVRTHGALAAAPAVRRLPAGARVGDARARRRESAARPAVKQRPHP